MTRPFFRRDLARPLLGALAQALDPHMAQPGFGYRTHGRYRVLRPSATATGALDAVFDEDAEFVTLRAADAALA